LKNNIPPFLRNLWLVLTEVPGWSDAPLAVRLRRTVPVVVPCIAIAALLTWNLAWQAPQVRALSDAYAPLLALEAEIEALQLACSEQQTVELTAQAEQISRQLLQTPQELAPLLRSLKKEATDRGWDASFHPGELLVESPESGGNIAYQPVRVKLAPAAGHAEVYASLLALLERFSAPGKRIDLMRLAIRADENRWHSVEANLRFACRVPHEKSPQ
jgi:hypothetical protein